ncbi:MAG: DUF4349 domain-containing protein [Acidimicrobiales bacterium]
MITEDELTDLLRRSSESITVPRSGPESIRAAATTGASKQTRDLFSRFRPRELVVAAGGLAAVIALIVVLVVGTGAPSVVTPAVAHAANGLATTNSTSGVTSKQATVGPRVQPTAPNRASSPSSVQRFARDIVATGTLRLVVGRAELPRAVNRLESLVASFGGYVGRSDVVESGRNVGGTLVLDVPASSFQRLVGRARATGTVRSLVTSDQDVTSQVVDLGARLRALVDERSQLEALLSKSGKVSDLLQVENQISFVQSEIEQIQGQQRVLSQQVAFSALTINLAVTHRAHHKASPTGFAHAWHVAITSFVDAVKSLVSVLGDLAFSVLALAVALMLAWTAWRKGWPRVRRRFA